MTNRSGDTSLAWQHHASKLADWADTRLVNRHDAWGAYGGNGAFTAPAKHRRGKDKLNFNTLANHFAGRQVLGVHSTSRDDTCKWLGLDVDAHGDGVDPGANWHLVEHIVNVLFKLGLEPIVEDSNDAGGFHIWTLFDRPAPAELVYRLGRLVKSRADAPAIEAFPKQPTLRGGLGNWLRIPGKHPKRAHWSRFYDPDSERWLDSDDAVEALLTAPVNDAGILEDLRPVLPPILEPTPAAPLKIIPGELPACIRDLLKTNIRRVGERNRATMALCRYFKAAGVPREQAVQQCVAFTRRVPPALTTQAMTDTEIEMNVRSVADCVYSNPQYTFECWHARTLGTRFRPIACTGAGCPFLPIGRIPVTYFDTSKAPEIDCVYP